MAKDIKPARKSFGELFGGEKKTEVVEALEKPVEPPQASLESKEAFIAQGNSVESWTTVDLKQPVIINGIKFGPGDGVLVPAEAHHVWKNALK